MSKKLSIEEVYTKKTQHEHILDLPDTYIGSIEQTTDKFYVYDDEMGKIIKKECSVVLGLYKIIDEILVNAVDNTVRDAKCNIIKIYINETGEIGVYNNGSSIPIEIHKDEKMYVPEMIFGNLLTSSNYDNKNQEKTEKIVGGKNGYGAKLANIYSTWFKIDIVDSTRKKKYEQTFSNNMFEKTEPNITKSTNESYTHITFLPDYKRFGIKNMTKDMIAFIKKRVYDIAGTTNKNVKVFYNDEEIKVKTFLDYCKLYFESDVKFINEEISNGDENRNWTVCATFCEDSEFLNMSFVNKVCTYQGGTHLDTVVNQIIKEVTTKVQGKNKDMANVKIKPSTIKNNLSIFVNAVVPNPSFSSQTKELLTTKPSVFSANCKLSEKFIKDILNSGLVDQITNEIKLKQIDELKKTDATKNDDLSDIPKYIKAKYSNKKTGNKCTLVLTEGDSAKATALAAISNSEFKDYIGVFPLKGKLLNIMDTSPVKIASNEEIAYLKRIIGLKQNAHYTSTKGLNYGHILVFTDMDHDGSHIKGLVMNVINCTCPSLLQIEGFIQCILTPLIRVKLKNVIFKDFYTQVEYKKWQDENTNTLSKYEIKYYKGLGTFPQNEAKHIFDNYLDIIKNYIWSIKPNQNIEKNNDLNDDEQSLKSSNDNKSNYEIDDNGGEETYSKNALILAFSGKQANRRKEWLKTYDENDILDSNERKIPIYDFVHKELKHFSNADNVRSLPNMIDGLKPSQRKVLYSCFKRNLTSDIKVSQLAGYVSEQSEYHHGEASLYGTIIKMAQNYCGSNNINLLYPSGQFGTIIMNGNDAASPRYIFTKLSTLTRKIFNIQDDNILNYYIEEGKQIEPKYYIPIIPMILINGTSGIGTGYSNEIPPYNILDIIDRLKKYLINNIPFDKMEELHPWYKDYEGTITKIGTNKYEFRGSYEIIDENSIMITSIPIDKSVQNYTLFLKSLKDEKINPFVSDYEQNKETNKVRMQVYFHNGELQKLIKKDEIATKLGLISKNTYNSMYVFNENTIVKYDSVLKLIEDYVKVRLDAYEERKKYYIKYLANRLQLITYKRKYILDVLSKKIIVERQSKFVVIDKLKELGYPELANDVDKGGPLSYNYITSIPYFSFTKEMLESLDDDFNKLTNEYNEYVKITIKELWINELNELVKEYGNWLITDGVFDGDDTIDKPKLPKTKTIKKDVVKKEVIKKEVVKKEVAKK